MEVLEMSEQACDLSEFRGAPVLDAHARSSSRSVYGTVAAARIEGGRGLATIQLSRADDARPIVDRIREGTLRSVSIGYQVLQSREERTNGMRTLVATRWRPRELSFVPIPADPWQESAMQPRARGCGKWPL
jgi:phage head maturation protease